MDCLWILRKRVKDYEEFQIKSEVLWHTEDFDGTVDQSAVITEVHEDHCIATTEDGINLWVDEDTEEEFIIIDEEV